MMIRVLGTFHNYTKTRWFLYFKDNEDFSLTFNLTAMSACRVMDVTTNSASIFEEQDSGIILEMSKYTSINVKSIILVFPRTNRVLGMCGK